MARLLARLSAVEVRNLGQPGLHHDGGGLYLRVTDAGTKSWVLRYMRDGKAHSMGLGPLRFVSLADARKKAYEWGSVRQQGDDPIEVRHRARVGDADERSFEEHAKDYIARQKGAWSAIYSSQWENTLKAYVYKEIGRLRPRFITVEHVRSIIEPLWETKSRTADLVRKRIEIVIDFAKASDPLRDEGGRWRENPARWRGTWQTLLPRLSRIAPVEHYRSLPYSEIHAFLADLRRRANIGVAPLEFLILTGARTGMVIGARWSEIDFRERTWTIPKERMKNRKEFRVPLGNRAIQILREMQKFGTRGFVFPGDAAHPSHRHIEHNTMLQMLQVSQWDSKCTVHGFRSTFSTWAAEETDFAKDIREMALAHTQGDATYAAYQRGDLLKKRRALMDAWSQFATNGQGQ